MSANSERREHTGINASFQNASENNNAIGVTNKKDEARRNSQDGVNELSVPGTQFDRQSHTHQVVTGVKDRQIMLAGGSEQIYNPHHVMTEPSQNPNFSYRWQFKFITCGSYVFYLIAIAYTRGDGKIGADYTQAAGTTASTRLCSFTTSH